MPNYKFILAIKIKAIIDILYVEINQMEYKY